MVKRKDNKKLVRYCRKCGAYISPLMGKYNWENKICQNCEEINSIPKADLAKNGLSIIDLM